MRTIHFSGVGVGVANFFLGQSNSGRGKFFLDQSIVVVANFFWGQSIGMDENITFQLKFLFASKAFQLKFSI